MKILLMGGFFFLGFILCIYNKTSVALGTLTFVIFVHISCGIIGYFLGVGIIIEDVLRPTGITGRVNILANIALFSCVFYGIRCFLENKNRWLLFYISFSSFILILLSGTLKNIISLFGAYVVYVFLSSKNKIVSAFFFIILALPLTYLVIFYTPIGERLIETAIAGVNVEVEEGEKLESSLQWRVLHWKLLLDDWIGRFFFQGSGIGQAVNMNALKISDGKGYSAHSDWLKYLVELGPIFFSVFIYYHYKLVKPLYVASREGAALESATFYTFIALVIAMLAGPVYFTVCFFYFFWLVLGVIAGKRYLKPEKIKKHYSHELNVEVLRNTLK
ncbi:O-antigen ligase family protein [Cognaticolwellia mytili]|uniref:O-antigen ligase family protein n=1 Tax=Cognaticolwellia mytili TaxID=1888913 RepID=UPI001301F150|nr:O-antigen ligase family protein [Cognaticolwellia mytili]